MPHLTHQHRSRPDALEHVRRLFRIIDALTGRTDRNPLGRQSLADLCECSVRSIQRDMELLQEFGVPVYYDLSAKTYRLTDPHWTFPLVALNAQDALALALARRLLSGPSVPFQHPIQQALDKAAAGLSPQLRALLHDAVQVLHPGEADRDYSRAPLTELMTAAQQCQSVDLLYRSRSRGGEQAWRCVDPYLVERRDGRYWELHAWDHKRQAIRTFALDQVRGLRSTDARFAHRDAEWAAFTAASGIVGGLRGGPSIPVDVRFAPDVAAYALDRHWPDGLTCTPQPDGSARLTGTAQGVTGLVPELLRWRRHAHALGGPELRAALTEEIQALAALYADSDADPIKRAAPIPPGRG